MARAHIEDSSVDARLSDGTVARVAPSRFAGGFELSVGDTPQSHVDLADPAHLHFEYVARMGAVIDLVTDPGAAITAVHLGGGALTLPRYIAHTRPGSRQQVVELEPALVELVRAQLPLPRGAQVRMRIGDAREVAGRLPAGLWGAAEVIVSDVFAGAQTPAHLTTVEYYEILARLLAPGGVLLVNVADGPGLAFARRQVATVRAVLPHAAVLAEAQVLKGRRFGNLVLVASRAELPGTWLSRLMAAGPHPAQVLDGAELRRFAQRAAPVRDADAVASPRPSASLFPG